MVYVLSQNKKNITFFFHQKFFIFTAMKYYSILHGHVNLMIHKDSMLAIEINGKAMNRNWSNQKANPALKTKAGNK